MTEMMMMKMIFLVHAESRMSAVKRAMLLMLVAAVAVCAYAHPHDDCGTVNKTMPMTNLDMVFGDWVLVWAVSGEPNNQDLLVNLSSSVIELHRSQDNQTVEYHERNQFLDKSCTKYLIILPMPSDDHDTSLHVLNGTFEKDGVVSKFNDSGDVNFYGACSKCMVMSYKGSVGHFLMGYRKMGLHQDTEDIKTHYSYLEKLAHCLGFPHDHPFTYDGTAEFCPKKSAPADQS
ncbi:saxitoxin and tetrodotoxin-binding protein 1-like [Pempheris klunzingeri]|uniref:saxitoxin and tetrodotoxin-binding protein 1-like n=1 Tax=Pempheris klunzingeri TaxID=3127111 RepID=UPI00397FB469